MATGDFTKQEASETLKAVNELFEALPKSKRGEFIGHLNDIACFIGAAKHVAPDEPTKTQG